MLLRFKLSYRVVKTIYLEFFSRKVGSNSSQRSSTGQITFGVPLGSNLGPLLFLLCISCLISALFEGHCLFFGYALLYFNSCTIYSIKNVQ